MQPYFFSKTYGKETEKITENQTVETAWKEKDLVTLCLEAGGII